LPIEDGKPPPRVTLPHHGLQTAAERKPCASPIAWGKIELRIKSQREKKLNKSKVPDLQKVAPDGARLEFLWMPLPPFQEDACVVAIF